MLRVYSILYLEKLWTEPSDASISADPYHVSCVMDDEEEEG
jgi:hypothetical protein